MLFVLVVCGEKYVVWWMGSVFNEVWFWIWGIGCVLCSCLIFVLLKCILCLYNWFGFILYDVIVELLMFCVCLLLWWVVEMWWCCVLCYRICLLWCWFCSLVVCGWVCVKIVFLVVVESIGWVGSVYWLVRLCMCRFCRIWVGLLWVWGCGWCGNCLWFVWVLFCWSVLLLVCGCWRLYCVGLNWSCSFMWWSCNGWYVW